MAEVAITTSTNRDSPDMDQQSFRSTVLV
uniref:Uncharacterized protein n=1 Tax=Arundo donax TaxID=35708 RepID=A0A0A9ARC8_ARUDO